MNEPTKDLNYYKRLPYTMRLDLVREPDGTSYWLAEFLELRGCETEGEGEADAAANLHELFDEYISMRLLENSKIPEPAMHLEENRESAVTTFKQNFLFTERPKTSPASSLKFKIPESRITDAGAALRQFSHVFEPGAG